MSQSEPTEGKVREKDIRALHARISGLESAMKAELDKKKNKELSDLEIEQIKSDVGKPHTCNQVEKIVKLSSSMASIEKSVQNIEGSLGRWKTVKLGGVLALVLAIISGAAYMIRTGSKTEAVKTTVGRIESDVSDMRDQIEEIKPDQYAEARTLTAIRDAIKEEMSR